MSRRLSAVLVHLALAVIALLTLAPLAWMVSTSFMPAGQANTVPPPLLPHPATLAHYRDMFQRLDLGRCLLNSVIVTVVTTLAALVLVSMTGYAFAKLRFRGRDRVFGILLAALVVPAQVGMLPLFLLLRAMGLVNTLWAAMIPGLASVFAIFLVRQFALSIPDELLDAARVDGGSEYFLYRTIVLPLLAPILATLAVFTFMSTWNDFLWPLIVLSDQRKYTLPVALANLVGEHVQDTELMMAGAVVTVLPVVIVFLVLQRYYVRGVMMGSVKG